MRAVLLYKLLFPLQRLEMAEEKNVSPVYPETQVRLHLTFTEYGSPVSTSDAVAFLHGYEHAGGDLGLLAPLLGLEEAALRSAVPTDGEMPSLGEVALVEVLSEAVMQLRRLALDLPFEVELDILHSDGPRCGLTRTVVKGRVYDLMSADVWAEILRLKVITLDVASPPPRVRPILHRHQTRESRSWQCAPVEYPICDVGTGCRFSFRVEQRQEDCPHCAGPERKGSHRSSEAPPSTSTSTSSS